MDSYERYEVWKIEHIKEGEWRWAIWDHNQKRVVASGVAETGDEATQLAQHWRLMMIG